MNRLRYRLSQWIYPHKCRVVPEVVARLVGGPASGAETTVSADSLVVHVPAFEANGHLVSHRYFLARQIYEYQFTEGPAP